MNILVTGGAGYIGSHTVRALKRAGYTPIVYDNLSTGHTRLIEGEVLIKGDIRNRDLLIESMKTHKIEAVVHLAALSLVGQSMQHPAEYYDANVVGGLTLLEAARACGVNYFVFSSSAAVYGEPTSTPITENHPVQPTSVYGRTKLAFETILADYGSAYGLNHVSLRYFNAAGADPKGDIGEDHDPETHLIPIVLQVALNQRDHISIFGTDYPTEDGTCVRDYVHVSDLADAHVLALNALQKGRVSTAINLGYGEGYTVRQVIDKAEKVSGHTIPVREDSRRTGDPAILVASNERAFSELGWTPRYASLERIIEHAWHWHRAAKVL